MKKKVDRQPVNAVRLKRESDRETENDGNADI